MSNESSHQQLSNQPCNLYLFVMKDFDYFKRYDGKPKSLKICDSDSINYKEINKYSVQQACFCIMCYVFCTSWNKVLTCGQLI